MTFLAVLPLAVVWTARGDEVASDLFEPIAVPAPAARVKRHVVQSQMVRVRLDALAAASPGEQLSLNLAPPARYVGVVERVDQRSEARFTVAGRLQDALHGTFVIVVEHDAVVGLIQDPTSGLLFKLRYLADGVHVINKIDSELYGRCGNEELPTDPPPGTVTHQTPVEEEFVPDPPPGRMPAGGCAPRQPVFDMLIVYTDVARQAAASAASA